MLVRVMTSNCQEKANIKVDYPIIDPRQGFGKPNWHQLHALYLVALTIIAFDRMIISSDGITIDSNSLAIRNDRSLKFFVDQCYLLVNFFAVKFNLLGLNIELLCFKISTTIDIGRNNILSRFLYIVRHFPLANKIFNK
jgi:translation initiation factor 2 gamma subunit (eIF-2gamma)